MQAAGELLAEGGVEALTTRSLAERTGIPVATIYRYFANRDEIIAAYLDHDLEVIQESLRTALLGIDTLTFRSAAEAVALAHLRHHQAHPEGVPVWFGGRLNPAVAGTVRALDTRLALSWRAALKTAGMLTDTPDFNAELLVYLADRMFEFVFREERSAAEQEAIVLTFVDMIANHMEQFATPTGVLGVPPESFLTELAQADHSLEAAAPERATLRALESA